MGIGYEAFWEIWGRIGIDVEKREESPNPTNAEK